MRKNFLKYEIISVPDSNIHISQCLHSMWCDHYLHSKSYPVCPVLKMQDMLSPELLHNDAGELQPSGGSNLALSSPSLMADNSINKNKMTVL